MLNRINTPEQLRERTSCNRSASADFDRFVLDLLEASKTDVALDIGPGLGRQMIPLAGTVRRIVGLDTIHFPTVESLMRYYDACAPYCRQDRRAEASELFQACVARDQGYRIVKHSLGLVGRR